MTPLHGPTPDPGALAEALAHLARIGQDLRWLSSEDRTRLERSTGFLGAHLDEALRRAFRPYTPAACRRLVREAGSSGSSSMGHRSLLAILAGPIPAVATGVLFPALAARCAVRIRPSSREPLFARLLGSLVTREVPELAPSVSVLSLRAQDPALVQEIRTAPVVIVYGSDETIRAIAALRGSRPLIPGGHRESLVLLDRESLAEPTRRKRLARAVAQDVCLYDQAGCLSPTMVFLESCPEADPFLRDLEEALQRASRRWPVASPSLETRAALRLRIETLRDRIRDVGGSFWSVPDGLTPVLAVLPPGVPPLRPSPGHRILQVLLCRDLADLPTLVPDLEGHLQGIAFSGDARRLRSILPPSFRGPRLCRPGHLQAPPAGWPENGRPLHVALAEILNRGPVRPSEAIARSPNVPPQPRSGSARSGGRLGPHGP